MCFVLIVGLFVKAPVIRCEPQSSDENNVVSEVDEKNTQKSKEMAQDKKETEQKEGQSGEQKDGQNEDVRTAENIPELNITSASAVLIEGSTGTILYEKNKDEQRMPASITKIMTLILIFEALDSGKIKLTDEVTVSEHAASMGGSQVYLEPNEKQTVDTMIKCISIASANDACVAMSEFIAGSESEFVNQMNAKAQELGMKNTHFLNCCGLDDDIKEGHYSSAYDIALMSRELVTKHPEISDYATVWMDEFTHVTKKGESKFGLTNTNKLVRYYNGITGLKTGSTSKAKYCLSASAKRNGIDLIAVVMAAPEPKTRFSEAASMLDYGFANCSMYSDDNTDMKIDPVVVKRGVISKITPKVISKFNYLLMKGQSADKIEKKVVMNENIYAPLEVGQQIGEVQYLYEGKNIGCVPVVVPEKIEEAKYKDYLVKVLKKFFIADCA